MALKKIAIVSTSRADMGLLTPLARKISESREFDLMLWTLGNHRYTAWDEIKSLRRWNYSVSPGSSSTNEAPEYCADVIKEVSLQIQASRPDLLFVLGDRFELLAVALSATLMRVPLAHAHGGEVSEGAFDDSFRHAITKLARLHFVSTPRARKRVLQLGEEAKNVFCVGPFALDIFNETPWLPREELGAELGMPLSGDIFVVTLHPTTHELHELPGQIQATVSALEKIGERLPNSVFICSQSNCDPGGESIDQALKEFCERGPDHRRWYSQLGTRRYFSLLRHATAMIGNSSSGILEAPFANCPAVNIGTRQQGRERGENVFDSNFSVDKILNAVLVAKSAKEEHRNFAHPFGEGSPATKVLNILRRPDLIDETRKPFVDLI